MKLPKAAPFYTFAMLLLPAVSGSSLRGNLYAYDAELSVPPVDEVSVLKQEIKDLHKHEASLEADKSQLVTSLQRMMTTNATAKLEKEVKDITQLKLAEEERFAHERKALEAHVSEAATESNDAKAVEQSLRDQNLDQSQELDKLRAEVDELRKKQHNIQFDKDGLLATLRTLMKDNSKLKKEVTKAQTKLKEADMKLQNLTTHCAVAGKHAPPKLHALHQNATEHTRMHSKSADRHGTKARQSHQKKRRHHRHSKEERYAAKLANDPTATMSLTNDIDQYLNRVSRSKLVDQWTKPEAPSQLSASISPEEQPPVAKKDHAGKLTHWLGLQPKVAQQAAQQVSQQAAPAGVKVGDPNAATVAAVVARSEPEPPKDVGEPHTSADGALSAVDALDPAAVAQEKAKKALDDANDAGDDVAKLLSQADAELNAASEAAP